MSNRCGWVSDATVEGEPTPAWADTLRTRQIMRNLLTNVARYGGAEVRVSVSSLGELAVFVVSDDGPGINVVDSEKIFDPYYRAQSDEGRPDSVGLGLAVARQLVRVTGRRSRLPTSLRLDQVRAHLARHPGAGIGCRPGQAGLTQTS